MTATQVSDGAAPELRERRAELRAIQAVLEDAVRGEEGQLLLVSGAAGMGKTALLRAAGAAAAESGFLVLGARGGELERSFPFGVVGQLFAPIVHGTREQGDEEDLLAGDARLAEVALSPVAGSPPRDADFALLNALYWLCANLCERSPVLLVVDDAQWADSASLRFLSFLARRGDGLALALAVAARTGEPGVGADPFAELGREDRARRIEPGPLSVAAVSGLVRERLWEGASDDLCRACHDATRGNALLVDEVIVGLRQSGKPLIELAVGDVDGVASAGARRASWPGSPRWDHRPARWPRPPRCSERGPSRGTPRRWRSSSRIGPSTSPTAWDGRPPRARVRARVRPSADQNLDLRRDPGRRARLGARRGRPAARRRGRGSRGGRHASAPRAAARRSRHGRPAAGGGRGVAGARGARPGRRLPATRAGRAALTGAAPHGPVRARRRRGQGQRSGRGRHARPGAAARHRPDAQARHLAQHGRGPDRRRATR